MKTASLHELKKELLQLPSKQLADLCVSLAKYKKDNKEFLGYLLFESQDNTSFVNSVKQEVDDLFSDLAHQSNLYYVKKTLRKILRLINKYCRYVGDKAVAADLHIYFCKKIRQSRIVVGKSQQLSNLYDHELKKINALIATLHEDLRGDYQRDLEEIGG